MLSFSDFFITYSDRIIIVPLTSPDGFAVIEFPNCTKVVLGWEHVNESTVRGHFRGYTVQ